MTRDILDELAQLRPSEQTLTGWTPDQRAAVLDRVLADTGRAQVRWLPRDRPRRVAIGIVTATVVAAVAVGVALGSTSGHAPTRPQAVPRGPSRSTPMEPPASALTQLVTVAASTSMPMLKAGQFVFRQDRVYLRKAGKVLLVETNSDWVNLHGDDWSGYRVPGQPASCASYPFVGKPNPNHANAAYFATLPTDPGALYRYLAAHVSGSSSTNAAIFTAIRDVLTHVDGLATAELRAAYIAVLGMLHHVVVQAGVRDPGGRHSTEASFTNPNGTSESLYFDPGTAQLVAEASTTHAGRIHGYDLVAERIVDRLPASVRNHCPFGGN